MMTSPDSPLAPWRLARGRDLALDTPRLMGVLNVTPDSFSDGGQHLEPAGAVAHALSLVADGAAIIDIGGASTRPGAEPVDDAEQIGRVRPVILGLRERSDVVISIDTARAAVAEAALDAGADVVNDVSAGLEDEGMLDLVAARGCGVVLMHRLAPPEDDSYSDRYEHEPIYADVTAAVAGFLAARVDAAIVRGVDPRSIVLDPGLGFGKSVEQNFTLIRETARLAALGHPLLGAASRKSFLGAVSGEPVPERRDPETIAATVLQWSMGIRLFRVHDVAVIRRALAIVDAAHGTARTPHGAAAAESPPDSPAPG
jgi:dihydropteroate synthase